MVERQIKGYSENGDSGSGGKVPREIIRILEILVPKTNSKNSGIERVIVAFDIAAKHCAAKTQRGEKEAAP